MVDALLQAFPDRPLGLTRRVGGWRTPRVFAAIALVLLIPTLIGTWYLAGEYALRQTLRDQGVVARTLSLDGECVTRQRSRGTRCTAVARYVVQPVHGGGEREATVTFHRRPMVILGNLPAMVYDPADSSRAMPREELGSAPSAGYFIAVLSPGLLMLVFAGVAVSSWRRSRRVADATGSPAFISVRNILRSTANELTLVFEDPRTGKPVRAYYDTGVMPLLVTGQDGGLQVLALVSSGGEAYPLDDRLAFLDLSDEERRAVLGSG